MLALFKRHPSSSITAFFAFIALLIPFVGAFRDATAPFGVSSSVWFVIATLLAAGVVLGQMWQAIVPTLPVSWGLPSIFGFLAAAATLVTPMIADLAGALAPLNIPQDVWVKVGGALTLVTLFGRIYQATGGTISSGSVIIPEPVPDEGGSGEPEA